MKKFRVVGAAIICAALFITGPLQVFGEEPLDEPLELLEEVQLKEDVANQNGIQFDGYIGSFGDEFIVRDTPEEIWAEVGEDLDSIDLNYRVEIDKVFPYMPNDEGYGWNQRKLMDLMEVPAVWKGGFEGKGVVVAVIDSGLRADHEEFQGIRIVSPFNSIDESADVTDPHGHGTFIAGQIVGKKNNGKGIAGVMDKASLMPIKFADEDGYGYLDDLLRGLRHAIDNGADVINMSFGFGEDVAILKEYCEEAAEKGIILVAAAGNDGVDTPHYPAYYSCVIGVGSVGDEEDLKEVSWFSQRGIKNVWCVAPGFDIFGTSDFGGGDYGYGYGTSFAAPYVSALGVMAKCIDSSVDGARLKRLVKKTALDLGAAGVDDDYGYGLINFRKVAERLSGTKLPFKYSHAKEIFVKKSKIEMVIGDERDIKVYFVPEDSINDCEWKSDDHRIATFEFEDNTLRAVGYGKTRVSVFSTDTGVSTSFVVQTRFGDVLDKSKYWYKPVYWAADNYIMDNLGWRETAGINEKCTKLDFVRMLWLMRGEPKVAGEIRFEDMKGLDKRYDEYKSALWADKNKIVRSQLFNPEQKISRKQAALLMYRAAGKPSIKGTSQYKDIKKLKGTESYNAILWCEKNGIINGYSDKTFRPNSKCNYATVYTILYRLDRRVFRNE